MAKTITFKHEATEYVLCYTRATVKKLFDMGFTMGMIETNPIKAIELLGYGSFLANHPNIKQKQAVEIICSLADGEDEDTGLAAVLIDMVSEALEETVLKKKGNVAWQVNK